MLHETIATFAIILGFGTAAVALLSARNTRTFLSALTHHRERKHQLDVVVGREHITIDLRNPDLSENEKLDHVIKTVRVHGKKLHLV